MKRRWLVTRTTENDFDGTEVYRVSRVDCDECLSGLRLFLLAVDRTLWLRGMREARAVNYAEAKAECSAALRIADSARLVGYLPIRLVPLDSGGKR